MSAALCFIVFAFTLLVVANPVPQGSGGFRDVNGELMPAEETLSLDEFDPLNGIDDLISSNNPGSSNDADCALHTSNNADSSPKNTIFRRGPAACRSNYPTPSGEPSAHPSQRTPTTYREKSCTKAHRIVHVWCGGPEVRYTPDGDIVFVMNCVPGNTVPSTLPHSIQVLTETFYLEIHTVIRPRPLYYGSPAPFTETREIAEYCCNTFEDKVSGLSPLPPKKQQNALAHQIWTFLILGHSICYSTPGIAEYYAMNLFRTSKWKYGMLRILHYSMKNGVFQIELTYPIPPTSRPREFEWKKYVYWEPVPPQPPLLPMHPLLVADTPPL